MTRREKELKVLKLFDLNEGDKVKVKFPTEENVLKIISLADCFALADENNNIKTSIYALFENDWQKVKASIKHKRCRDFTRCDKCPFNEFAFFCCNLNDDGKTMEEIYKEIIEEADKIKEEIYTEGE